MILTNVLIIAVVVLSYLLFKSVAKMYKMAQWFQKVKIVMDSQKSQVDLELATSQQIVDEMASRPNNRFLLLTPHQRSGDLHIEIHSANVPVPLALNMLKATYEGVIDVVRRNGGEIEEE